MIKILALGEAPHGANQKEIREILESNNNLSGIFLEHPINYQDSINVYLQDKKIDEKLSGFWERCLKEGNDIKTLDLYILNFAIKRGVPVICIDSSKTETSEYNKKSDIGYWFLRGESRDEDMYENIIRECKEEGEWIILCGAGHLTTEIHSRSGKKSLGARLKKRFGEGYSYKVLGQ